MHDPLRMRTILYMQVILVATDGSAAAGAALDAAIALAAETGGAIAAITVWQALQGDYGLAYPSAAKLEELLDAEGRTQRRRSTTQPPARRRRVCRSEPNLPRATPRRRSVPTPPRSMPV